MEDLRNSKRLPNPTVFCLKRGQGSPRNRKKMRRQNGQNKMPNCKQHAVTQEFMGFDRWEGLLQGDCWCSSGAGKGYCSCAVHWVGCQPRETSGWCNFNWCQWRTFILRNTEACRKVKRQHMEHSAEKSSVGRLHYGLVHKSVSIQVAMKIPEAEAAVTG